MTNLIRRNRRTILFLITAPAALIFSLAAFAVWTTNSVSQQQITAGTGPQITLSSTQPNTLSPDGLTLTFAPYSDAQPSFTAGDQDVTVNNSSLTAATLTSVVIAGTPGAGTNSTALNSELSVCIANDSSLDVLYNGPLSGASSLTSIGATTIGAQSSAGYIVNVYAGSEPTYCGSTAVGSAPPNAQADYPNLTAIDATSTAPVLANDAQGGIDNVSVSITYQ